MLCLSQSILNQPILSLRLGGPIATSGQPIINPNNLKIEGFYAVDKFNGQSSILLTQDIREIGSQGLVVNDNDALTEPEHLVRLRDIIEINFTLIGKPVQTVSGDKIGKVTDFAIDSSSFYVHKIYVSQSLLKNFSGGSLSVDRTQIHEITNRRIVINDLAKDSRIRASAPVPA